jgi:hypothetical protein
MKSNSWIILTGLIVGGPLLLAADEPPAVINVEAANVLAGIEGGEPVGQALSPSVTVRGDDNVFTANDHTLTNTGSPGTLRLVPDRSLLNSPFDAERSTLTYSIDLAMARRTHASGGASMRFFVGAGTPQEAAVRLDVTGVRKMILYTAAGEQFIEDEAGKHLQLPQPTDGVTVPVTIALAVDYGAERVHLTVDGRPATPEQGLPFLNESAATPALVIQNIGTEDNGRYLPLSISKLTLGLE